MTRLSELRICFLAGTLGQGGAERQLFYITHALKKSGAAVRVLSLTDGEFWEEPIRALGIDVTWVGRSEVRMNRLRAIVRALRPSPPHILQSQHFFANTYASLAARWLRIREVGAIRSNARDEIRQNGRLFGTMNLRLPRAMVVNSKTAIANAIAQKVPPTRLHYLANVVDTEQFAPPPLRRIESPLRLLSVGRLVPLKRHDMLLRAAARLRDATGAVSLTIAGDGPLQPDLKQLARDLSLGADVHFAGTVDPAMLAQLYRDSDVFILTSEYEGTPNVVLEAMSAGLPVVSTAVGGVPAVVDNRVTGLLVEPGSEEELAAALVTLARDSGMRRRFGAASRSFIEERHSIFSLPPVLEEIYNAALA